MIQIREFQETAGDYEALAHVINSVWHEPSFTVDDLKQLDAERPAKCVMRRFLAEISGRVVAHGSFEHNPKFYHAQRFWLRLDVLPDARRQGVGGQLYAHMLDLLEGRYNANELHTITTESRADSIRFLNKRGFQESKRDPLSQLIVARFDGGRTFKQTADIAAGGIEIRVLSDLMKEDAEALHKVYELHQLLVNDVPEPAGHTRVDFESWREGYSPENPYFIPEAHFLALNATAPIGLTSLWGLSSSDRLYTGMTGVKRAYRRRGVATALKMRSIAYAQTRNTRLIMTSNNSENPMYQLNLKLGFQTYDVEIKLVKKL